MNISTTAQIVVAVALPVDLATAATRMHLTAESGESVALHPPTVPEANTLVISAKSELHSLSYAVGATIGAAEVAGVVAADHMSVVDLQPGFYDWAFFAMDSSTNYATPTHVPFVSAATLTWCPSESGTYQASSTDTGTQALLLTPSGKDQVQTSATPLGSTTPLSLATVVIGTSYSLRFSAVGSDGEYRSVPHPFVASDASLAVLAQPTGVAGSTVGLGANAVFGFNAYAWPAFEAAVDTDPVPSSEAWSPIAVSANGPASTVSKSMGSAGAFKLRVRPVVCGCSPAAWIESNEFTVGGGARYVSQAVGSDSNDGTSRVSPYQTLDKALAVAHGANTLDIYVAQGTYTPTAPPRPANYNWSHWPPGTAQIYTQGLVVPASTRIFGGYASDFLSRDPALIDSTLHAVARAHETIIQGDLWSEDYEATGYDSENCHTAITALTGTGGIALDGLTIQATGAEDTDQTGVFLGQFVDMQINNCHLRGTTTGSNGNARGLEARCGVPLRFTNNWFEPHGNHASEEAVKIECAAHPTAVTLTGNLMTATNGLNVSQNNFASAMVDQPLFTIDHNRIMYNTSPGAPTDGNSIGFICSGAVRLGFTHNILTPGFNVFALSGATAFISTDHCFGVVSDNLIDGGTIVNSSNAFQIAGAIPLPVVGHPAQSLLIANNIISAGLGSQHRNGVVWQGSNPDAQSTGEFLFVHNDFLASSGALGQLGQNGAVLFGAGGSQYTAYAGRIINNLFFGKWTNQQGQMFQHGIIDSFQNNLIVLDPRLELYDDNGTKVFDMAGFQTKMCTSPKQVFAGGNVGISAAVSSLFKNFAGDDAAYANLEAADFTPITSAFAIGLDTTQSLCGGINDNTADACTGARGSETCGNVTLDAAGVTRPAMPSAGAFEPAP